MRKRRHEVAISFNTSMSDAKVAAVARDIFDAFVPFLHGHYDERASNARYRVRRIKEVKPSRKRAGKR